MWHMQYPISYHSWFQVCVRSDYTFEILINSYSNPMNRAVRWNGGCCDDVECEDSGCENQFHFTAQPLSNSGQIGSAVIPSTHTGYLDSEVENLHVSIESSGQWLVRCTLGNCSMILQRGYDCASSFIVNIGWSTDWHSGHWHWQFQSWWPGGYLHH